MRLRVVCPGFQKLAVAHELAHHRRGPKRCGPPSTTRAARLPTMQGYAGLASAPREQRVLNGYAGLSSSRLHIENEECDAPHISRAKHMHSWAFGDVCGENLVIIPLHDRFT